MTGNWRLAAATGDCSGDERRPNSGLCIHHSSHSSSGDVHSQLHAVVTVVAAICPVAATVHRRDHWILAASANFKQSASRNSGSWLRPRNTLCFQPDDGDLHGAERDNQNFYFLRLSIRRRDLEEAPAMTGFDGVTVR
ncbi:unnamed protein product [Striga asiatica]|uniref:Uncharacterized protein n=1 Tax=Striga asiatica TaxID=4170 RepID=A0A5A7RIV9_STRAF|nr:unnamed protein product [Striga asiatica]